MDCTCEAERPEAGAAGAAGVAGVAEVTVGVAEVAGVAETVPELPLLPELPELVVTTVLLVLPPVLLLSLVEEQSVARGVMVTVPAAVGAYVMDEPLLSQTKPVRPTLVSEVIFSRPGAVT